MANYKGTIVPQEGYVEKIYFNTNLKPNEISSILNKIKPSENDSQNNYSYIIAVNKEDTLALIYSYEWDSQYLYITDADGNYNYIYSKGTLYDDNRVISFNGELSTTSNNFEGTIATQNEMLKDLFSITPFIVEKNILMHPKDEKGKLDNNIKLFPQTLATNLLASNGKKFKMPNVVYQEEGWTGEKIPNKGYVEEIYVNTQLTNEEVVDIISKLEYEKNENYGESCYVVACEYNRNTMKKFLIVNKYENETYSIGFGINLNRQKIIFCNDYNGGYVGWEPLERWNWDDEAGNPIQFKCETSNIFYDNNQNRDTDFAGTQNEKLAGLFSLIPSYKTKAGFFQPKEDGLADETKPLPIGSGGGVAEEKVEEIVDEKIGDIDAILDEINGGGTIGGSSGTEVAIEFSVETTATSGKYKLTQITPFTDWYKVKDAKISMKGTGENLYEIQSRLPNINGMFNQTTHEAMAFGFSSMYAASDTPSFATFSYTAGTNGFTYKVTGDFLYQVDIMLGLGVTNCTLIVTI